MQLAGVIRHRPVLMVVVVDQLVKPLEQLELAAYPAVPRDRQASRCAAAG